MKQLLNLYFLFCKISLFTFGGGYAMVPLFQSELVTKHQFLSLDAFANMVALAQMTPGPIGMNSATYIGYDQAGVLGAFLATLGVVTPSLVLTMAAAAGINRWKNSPALKAALSGIRPAVLGLIAAAVIFFAEASVFETPLCFLWQKSQNFCLCWQGIVIFAAVIAVELTIKPNLIITVAGAGALGWLLGLV